MYGMQLKEHLVIHIIGLKNLKILHSPLGILNKSLVRVKYIYLVFIPVC